MRKIILLSLFAIFTVVFSTTAHASARLIIDSRELTNLPSPPVLQNARVLVPARAVFEEMGGVVGWHDANQQVTVLHGDNVLVMTIGSSVAILNGRHVTMQEPAIIINQSTMIPLRFPAEAFGFDVDWDPEHFAAIINSPPAETSLPAEQEQQNSVDENQGHNLSQQEVRLAQNLSSAPLTGATHAQTNITHVSTPEDINQPAYIVHASSAMSNISYFILSDNRLVLDISNAIAYVSGAIPSHESVPVNNARIAQFSASPAVTRVVFELKSGGDFYFILSADRRTLTISFDKDNIYVPVEEKPVPRPRPDNSRFVVVLDPGHGGSDPGTIHNGIIERDYVLAMAHRVASLFDNNQNIDIVLTREENKSMTLLNRAAFANELNADLFISIHVNAAQFASGVINQTANGIETWYNFGELESSANNPFTSRQFANIVQRQLIGSTGAANRGTWYGDMIVLLETQMPSVLLELGFVTNPAEAARLANVAYQVLLAQAIHDAIIEAYNTFISN